MIARRFLPVTCVLLALLGGCTSPEFNASSGGSYPPFQGEVEVMTRLPEPGSYELVGVVMVRGAGFTSDERMFDRLRDEAGQRGADAVIPQGKIKDRPKTDGGEERRLAGYAIRRKP